ncbi:MAG: alpha/beta hydrolase [Verrucomicrobiota bacterium]
MPLPALILIHGYPFDHTMWKDVVLALENKTKVMTPDLPGFGDNPARNDEPSIDLMADDVAGLLQLHSVKRAVVAGMSMGGYVALSFAEKHKEYIAGLGLISTQAITDTPEIQQSRRNLIEKVQRDGTKPAVETLLPKMFSAANQNNSGLTRFPIDGAEKAGVEGICWALEAMARRPDRTGLLRTLKIPATVIHGTEDKIIPPERARQMSQMISNSKYVELPGVGHASPLEAPKAVADALLDLLRRSENFSASEPDKRFRDEPGIIIAPTERGL